MWYHYLSVIGVNMKKIVLLIVCLFILCSCNSNKELSYKEIMETEEFIIIDVRTKEEYEEGHIVNAINIPYDEIDSKIDITKDIVIFVYCKSGNRSTKAYNTLKELGYEVYNLGAYDSIDLEKDN